MHFPIQDGIDTANEIGVESVVQPGGSMRSDSISAADEHDALVVKCREYFQQQSFACRNEQGCTQQKRTCGIDQ